MHRVVAGSAVVLSLAGTMVGCSSNAACNPEPPRASPTTVQPGDFITVSSAGFACGSSFNQGKSYDAQIVYVGRQDSIDLGDVAVATDGTFTVTLRVPEQSSPGEAAIGFSPNPLDCPDDASCAGYSASFTIS